MSAYEKIKKDGLENYLDHLVQYPKSFQNENGDYVWLYLDHEDEKESEKGNLYFLYTPSSFINEKYVSATRKSGSMMATLHSIFNLQYYRKSKQ